MSDRFYSQMAAHCNVSEGELKMAFWDKTSPLYKSIERKIMPKLTKADLTESINEVLGVKLAISKLNLAALETILDQIKGKKTVYVEVPSGRLKAPYYEAIHKSLSLSTKAQVIDLSTVTVAVLVSLLEAINDYTNR